MSIYYSTQIVNGYPMKITKACPFDGLTNLTFPVYLNHYNASGLVQPYGSVGDNNLIVPSGIVRPAWNPQPSGNFRAAPSGLSETFTMGYAMGTDGFGLDQRTYYSEINWYQNYWTCPNGHFFIYPSGIGYPSTTGMSNISDTPPPAFGNFE